MKTPILHLTLITLAFVCKAQLTQTVRGTVQDRQLGTPIAGATIQIKTTNAAFTTESDSNGVFRLSGIPVGRHDVMISKEGYKPNILPNVMVESGKETVLDISAEEDIREIKEVVITSKRDKSQAQNGLITNSVQVLRAEDVNRFAGSRNDPSRMASSYAGVAGGDDQRNDIIVRGNSPLGVLWRMEGVDIYNPNHFTFTGNSGGAFSVLNNNLLANTDFLTGAFPAEYGNRTAAVFDVRLRKGNNKKRENTFQIGLSGIEFMTEGPLSKKSGASYIASYRFFTFGALDKLGVSIGANGLPQYNDVNFKFYIPTEKLGTFTVWGIGGKSHIDLTFTSNDTVIKPVEGYASRFTSDMTATGISNEHKLGEKTKGKLSYAFSGASISYKEHANYFDNSKIDVEELTNKEGHHIFQYVVTHKYSARSTVRVGATTRRMFFNNYERYLSEEDTLHHIGWNNKGGTWLTQGYIHWHFRINDKLEIHPGLYGQYFALSKSKALEPRFGIVYQANAKNTFSFASGMHSQTLPLFLYQYKIYDENTKTELSPNKDLDLMRSVHFVAGYKRSLTQQLRLKTEVYYQYMYDVPVSQASNEWQKVYSVMNTGAAYNFNVTDSTVNKGTGRNYGVEVTLERFFNKGYYFLTTLSLLKSEYKAGDGKWRSTVFDIGHAANALAGKEFKLDAESRKTISVDIKLTHSGGRRIIPVDVNKSIAEKEEQLDFANAYEKSVRDYFRTDLKISYNVNRPKATHNIFIAADNVTNRQNVLTQYWSNSEGKVKNEYQLGIFPYLGYKVNF